MYDVLESDLHINGVDGSRYAENDYFSQAVCLNERGKIQAKAMGEHIKYIGLPISTVVSSVSCRARQTADLTFGGYDSQHRLLVHTGPYNEIDDDRTQILKEFYVSLPVISGGNVIVSAHNSVVKKEIFENPPSGYLEIEEGGFYVISQRDGKLYLEHEFHNFASFMKIFYDR
jgi:phosphohistidine phosphatase SixA